MDDAQKAAKRAFEGALAADPYDETCHKIYADFLSDAGADDEAEFHRTWTAEWQAAHDWTMAFCQRVDLNPTYFLEQARKHLEDGSDIDCHMNTSNATADEDMPLLWVNVATVLRLEDAGGADDNPFTCGSNGCFPAGLTWEAHPEDREWDEGESNVT